MTLQLERKYSTQGSGAPCHVSFGFFSGFFGIFLPKLQMDPQPEFTTQPKARGLLHMECDFAITLPYQLRHQDNAGIVEDLQGQHSRTFGTTREDFRIAQTSVGVHSSLRMLRLLLRTFDLYYSRTLEDYSLRPSRPLDAILLDYKVLGACRMDLPGPTTSVGTRTDYSVGPWDYPTCAARYLMA
jgi:hypothetical protein